MSTKIKPDQPLKPLPSVTTKEPCLWKNNPFPTLPNLRAKPINSINYLLKEKWIYAIDTQSEYYNHRLKTDFIKNTYFSFLHSGKEFLILNITSITVSLIHCIYSLQTKLSFMFAILSFLLLIALSVYFVISNSTLSLKKSPLIEALQYCIALNYTIHLCNESMVPQYLSIAKCIISACLICIGNMSFNNQIFYSRYIYFVTYICIALSKVKKYTFLSYKYVFELIIEVLIFEMLLQLEKQLRIKKLLIWNSIDNFRYSAKIIHNTFNCPIMKLNNKKGVEYLNNAAIWLFKEATHKKSTSTSNENETTKNESTSSSSNTKKEKVVKIKEKISSKASMAQRIKQVKTNTKKCVYNLHDILINEDYFDYNSYNCLMGKQKYFIISFIPSSIEIDKEQTRFLGYSVAGISNINTLTYRAEIVPYWKEKDKYLFVLYPNIERQYTKFMSRMLEKVRNSVKDMLSDLGKCCESFVEMLPQDDSSREEEDDDDNDNDSQILLPSPREPSEPSILQLQATPQVRLLVPKNKILQHPSKTGFRDYGFSTPIRQPKIPAAMSTKLKPRSLADMTEEEGNDLKKEVANLSPLSLNVDFEYLTYALWFQFQYYWFAFSNTLLSLKYCHLFFLSSFSMKYIDINLDHVFTYLSLFFYIPSQKHNLDIQFILSGERLLSTRFDYFKAALLNLLFFLLGNLKISDKQQTLIIKIETFERKTNNDNSYYYYQYVCDSSRGSNSRNFSSMPCYIPNEIFFGEMPKDDVWIKFSVDYTDIELNISLKEALEHSGDLYDLGNLSLIDGKQQTTHFSLYILNFIIRHIFGGSIHLVFENGKQKMNFTLTARKSRKKEDTYKDVSGGFGVTPKMQSTPSSKITMSPLRKGRSTRKNTVTRIPYLIFIPPQKYDIVIKYLDQVLFSVYKIKSPIAYTLYLPSKDPQNKLHSKWSTKNLQGYGKDDAFVSNRSGKNNAATAKHVKSYTGLPPQQNDNSSNGVNDDKHKRETSEPVLTNAGKDLSEGISVFSKGNENETKGQNALLRNNTNNSNNNNANLCRQSSLITDTIICGKEKPKTDFFSLIKSINKNSSPTEPISIQQQHEKLFHEAEIKHGRPKSDVNKIYNSIPITPPQSTSNITPETELPNEDTTTTASNPQLPTTTPTTTTTATVAAPKTETKTEPTVNSIIEDNKPIPKEVTTIKEGNEDEKEIEDKKENKEIITDKINVINEVPSSYEDEKQQLSPKLELKFDYGYNDNNYKDVEDNNLSDIYGEVDLMDKDVLMYRALKDKIKVYFKIGKFVFEPNNIVNNTAVQKRRFKEVRQITSAKIKKAIQAIKLIE